MTREIEGGKGKVVVHVWEPDGEPTYLVLLSHGYGEHAGRHAELAERLAADGAVVFAPDHYGHGASDGERSLVDDADVMLEDFARVYDLARDMHPGLPVLLFAHSMGGLLATVFVQENRRPVDALVLSSPLIGGNPGLELLLDLDEIPEIPIDPSVISRDEAEQQAYAADELNYHGPFRRETLETLVATVARVRQGRGFGELPVLWIHGTGDMLVPFDLTSEVVEGLRGPATEERAYEEARHELFHETNREEVYADLFDFIGRSV